MAPLHLCLRLPALTIPHFKFVSFIKSKSLLSEQLPFIEPTGFNASANSSLFSTPNGPTSFMPPPTSTNNTSPANVFAQMKSGTFANDNDNNHNVGLGPHSGTFLVRYTFLH